LPRLPGACDLRRLQGIGHRSRDPQDDARPLPADQEPAGQLRPEQARLLLDRGETNMQLKLTSVLVAAAFASTAAHAVVTDSMIQSEATSTGNVLTWGINTQGQRYSPLKQVNTATVGKLAPVWAFSFGGEKQRGQEAQPVIHNGKMFVTASYSRLFALDAVTGRKLWKYEHRLPEGIMP